MLMKKTAICFALLTCLALTPKSTAVELAWFLDGSQGAATTTGDNSGTLLNLGSASGVLVSDISYTGFNLPAGSNAFDTTAAGFANPDAGNGNYWLFASDLAAGAASMTFSIEATQPNQAVSLQSFSFDYFAASNQPNMLEMYSYWNIEYSTDNSNWSTLFSYSDYRTPFGPGDQSSVVPDSRSFNPNTVAEKFYIRFTAYRVESNPDVAEGLAGIIFSNFRLQGDLVTIPEPTSALFGLLGTGLFFVRRRK